MGVIDQYWAGVLQRMQAEVAVFNRLIAHQGERGRENEQALVRVLTGLVPGRYAVGTGLLFDTEGGYSRQLDIVITDQIDSPSVLAQTNQLLHPVEEAVCCVEVKTTLNKREIEDSARKKRSVLERAGSHRPPLFALFAYDAETSPRALLRNLEALPPLDRPDLLCVLDPGIVGGRTSVVSTELDDVFTFSYGVTLLHAMTETGERVPGQYIPGETDSYAGHEERGGVVYPVVAVDGGRMLAEPSRALLLFCEALLRYLAAREERAVPVLSRYLDDVYRELHSTAD